MENQTQPTTTPVQQPVATPPPAKVKMKKVLLSFLAVIVLLSLMGGSYVAGSNQNKTPSTLTATPAPTITQAPSSSTVPSDWKTYTNKDLKFSMQYPPTWSFADIKELQESTASGVKFIGEQGSVSLVWGSGFGGGCNEADQIELSVFGETVKACHALTSDGGENIHQIYKTLPTMTFSASATVSTPYVKNHQVVTKILETLVFNDTAALQTYTSSAGKFSLSYPSNYKLTEDKQGILLLPSDGKFRMSINYTQMGQTIGLAQFIEKTDPCVNEYILTYKKETLFPVTLGKTYFSVAQDTFCGQWGQTHLYTSPDRKMYYDVEIETTGQYKDVKTEVEAILQTLVIKQ